MCFSGTTILIKIKQGTSLNALPLNVQYLEQRSPITQEISCNAWDPYTT